MQKPNTSDTSKELDAEEQRAKDRDDLRAGALEQATRYLGIALGAGALRSDVQGALHAAGADWRLVNPR